MASGDEAEVERELEELQNEKGEAVASQEFEKAADYRDKMRKLQSRHLGVDVA